MAKRKHYKKGSRKAKSIMRIALRKRREGNLASALNVLKKAEAAHYNKNPSEILGGKSIHTEYFGPTNTRGARIKASVLDGNKIQKSMSVVYPHELDMYDAHIYAAEQMRNKMGWKGDLIGVQSRKGYVFGFKEFAAQYKKNPRKSRFITRVTSGEVLNAKPVYLQERRGAAWFTLAIMTGMSEASMLRVCKRYSKQHPTKKLRLFR